MNLEHHDILLSNFVLGEAKLFRLTLPQGWRLKRGFSPPELHAVHQRRGVPWVASAYLHYLLESLDGRYLLEFAIRVGPHPHRVPGEPRPVEVSGHPGRAIKRVVRRGPPWARKPTSIWTLTWHCPLTERYFLLELSGRAPDEVFTTLLAACQALVCH